MTFLNQFMNLENLMQPLPQDPTHLNPSMPTEGISNQLLHQENNSKCNLVVI
jgi:hypothetical protein